MKAIYTKQKYIDKYNKGVKERLTRHNGNRIKIKNYTLLPNGKRHGIYTCHYFDEKDVPYIFPRTEAIVIANAYGLTNFTYNKTCQVRYYLGHKIEPKAYNSKLLGCNWTTMRSLRMSKELKIWWDYRTVEITPGWYTSERNIEEFTVIRITEDIYSPHTNKVEHTQEYIYDFENGVMNFSLFCFRDENNTRLRIIYNADDHVIRWEANNPWDQISDDENGAEFI